VLLAILATSIGASAGAQTADPRKPETTSLPGKAVHAIDLTGDAEQTAEAKGQETLSLRWLLAPRRRAGLYLAAGAGLYILNLVEQLGDGMVVEEYARQNTFGGYVGPGLNIPLPSRSERWAIDVGMKVHFVNYGTRTSLVSPTGTVGGPVYTFHVGFVGS